MKLYEGLDVTIAVGKNLEFDLFVSEEGLLCFALYSPLDDDEVLVHQEGVFYVEETAH
jgi:hypothetical protein